jgi:hypothetical protein
MKNISNIQTEIKTENETLTYSSLITAVLNVPPQGGYSAQDIETRIKIRAVMKESNGEILLEDSDFSYLKGLVKNMRWGIEHQDLLNFCTYIENLK